MHRMNARFCARIKVSSSILIISSIAMAVLFVVSNAVGSQPVISLDATNTRSFGDSTGVFLSMARAAAAADRHEEAIQLYLKVCTRDTSMVAELGKEIGLQYTWNDQPKEALPWFKAFLSKYPDDIEGLLGYARALSWADRHEESLSLYRSIQRRFPGSIDAGVGEARVVSWMDRNEEAEALYREILHQDPANIEARLGLAQVINWQGRHREARSHYEAILHDDPGNDEALLGLAQSERWLGRNDKARRVLGQLAAHEEAQEILAEIDRGVSHYARFLYGISSDSDDLVIHRLEGGFVFFFGDLTSVGMFGERFTLRQTAQPKITMESISLRFFRRFNEDWSLNVNLTPLKSSFDLQSGTVGGGIGGGTEHPDFNPFTFDGWVTWTPHWRYRMDVSGYRMIVETPLSVQREITFGGIGASLDVRLAEGATIRGGYDHRSYSDGNERNLWSTDVVWRIFNEPVEVQVVPGYIGFSFSEWKENGYYNPTGYHNLGCALVVESSPLRELSFRVGGRISAEKEEGEKFFGVGTFQAAAEWGIMKQASVGGEFFTSNSRIAGEAGYSRTLGEIYFVVRF